MDSEIKRRPKKKLGSYPSISVVLSITLALFVLGLFGMLMIHTNRLTTIIKESVEIQVYLQKEITENQRIKVLKTLAAEAYVVQGEEGPDIVFVSKEEAAEEFKESTGEDFSDFLGENPLRDLLRVKIKPDYQPMDSLNQIIISIEAMGGVYEVAYVANLVDSINNNLAKISVILAGFALILILIVILLINNTIKLALFSQRFLIRSMQLVGATSGFIRIPFLRRASLYGLLAGVLAVGGLYGLLNYAYQRIGELRMLTDEQQLLILFVIIILTGLLLALISTYRAISKYLKMSLDDLY
jgi:cell division transport system permease protein